LRLQAGVHARCLASICEPHRLAGRAEGWRRVRQRFGWLAKTVPQTISEYLTDRISLLWGE